MEVTNIEKYPRYVVDVEHGDTTYTVHINEDVIYDEHFITHYDSGNDLSQDSDLYNELLEAAYGAIRADKNTISKEDLLQIASIANPNVMSTPEMLYERLVKIDALIKEMIQTTKTA